MSQIQVEFWFVQWAVTGAPEPPNLVATLFHDCCHVFGGRWWVPGAVLELEEDRPLAQTWRSGRSSVSLSRAPCPSAAGRLCHPHPTSPKREKYQELCGRSSLKAAGLHFMSLKGGLCVALPECVW